MCVNNNVQNIRLKNHFYRNLPKINPPSKIHPPPFYNEVVAKGAFLSKLRPPIYATVHAVKQEAPKKQHEGTLKFIAHGHIFERYETSPHARFKEKPLRHLQ